jgi:hypothetical protein
MSNFQGRKAKVAIAAAFASQPMPAALLVSSQQKRPSHSIKNRFSLRAYQDKHQQLLTDLSTYLSSLNNAITAYCDIYSPRHPQAFSTVNLDRITRNKLLTAADRLHRVGSLATFLPLLMAMHTQESRNGQDYLQHPDGLTADRLGALQVGDNIRLQVHRPIGRPASANGRHRDLRNVITVSHSSAAPIVRRTTQIRPLSAVRAVEVGVRDWSDSAPSHYLSPALLTFSLLTLLTEGVIIHL